ncbi:PRD domain-containing protein [Listeria monocytogenes]|nr:PRD domain-containing protein [Listeria monocytogenes]EAH3957169.1 PRD domain-containing protein [Listeria monocytogenes]
MQEENVLMLITRILNNNVVFSVNEAKEEVIVTGLGVGFKKKIGDAISQQQIEKIFTTEKNTTNNRFIQLLEEIPFDYFSLADGIIQYAEQKLSKPLNKVIYVTLTDHIHYAIIRYKEGIFFENRLLWEIKKFYPEEFKIAKECLLRVNEYVGVELPEDEAGFMALHIVNAENGYGSVNETMQVTVLIQDVLNIIRYHFKITSDENSLEYQRLIVHLKFFTMRMYEAVPKKTLQTDKLLLRQIIYDMPEAYECTKKINEYLIKQHNYRLENDEVVFLTAHIERLIKNN